ncbi:hypothetical protein PICMEDRAFT_34718 [Pichia membranifaciens NRRL Y-2026]|uniref:DNA repair and recombination protein RAD26 n=1 Tax=Pichia membranifaciens NRRL Y-2026 TaxID=763406 RepID=A0A1E3NLB2_9ASCO|nr:hypothetical protein PICMEDRAFT_34718 [Pichia membranifaciens NRRL Y-2026]ODQ46133.1 hypothetical protein PICMEDRAFT_34718 [Pichia membranifaciens NRRL Y-2026]
MQEDGKLTLNENVKAESGDESYSGDKGVESAERLSDLNKADSNNQNQPGALAHLNIKILDQNDFEKQVEHDADKAIYEKELEIEEKRLAKANDKYLKFKGKLLTLQKRLHQPNLKISEKTRIGVQIEELEENEIMQSLKDLEDIKERMKKLKRNMQPVTQTQSAESNIPQQLPEETREEYLIRTGKITAFGTANAFIEENNDADRMQVPTHKNLIMPGFNNIAVVDEKDKPASIDLESIEFLADAEEEGDDGDFKIDYDEINSDDMDDDSEVIDEIYTDDDIDVTQRKKRRKKSATDELIIDNLDDGNETFYEKRLNNWVSQRSAMRLQNSPDYVDDPSVPEWYKPHPTIKDAILNDKFRLPGDIFPSLFDYQKTCVQWLSELYNQKTGGIIGDEMGLGKTIQMISFLAGLHYSQNLRGPILVVCPATVLRQWCNEFHRWWPPFRAVILHSIGEGLSKTKSNKRSAEDDEDDEDLYDLENEDYGSVPTLGRTKDNKVVRELVEKVVKNGHVLITTYAGVRMYAKYLIPVKWGYVVLDEGHKIRNPDSFITITCKQLRTPNRIILSGTPIQNNLIELWSLFDFVFPGRLGTLPVFQRQFCVPINLGGYANATNVQVQAGYKCAVVLKDLVSPYLLRRVKTDVAKDLPKKTEMVLFCKLTPEQRRLYKKFIDSADLKRILEGKRNALFGIDMLRKICNHPNLVDLNLKDKKITKLPSIEELSSKSGKIQVVMALLELWKREDRKTLIFTQTKQMLNILQQLLDLLNESSEGGYKYMRMDGSTPIIQRQSLVDQFNLNPQYKVFLLTTRVGGLGVNLTGASRVIIYDPDWNPSTDMQARERAWRLGQKQDVAIYRLIMASSIEEKIYHRQIFKQFLTNKILKDPKQKRFFKMTDMYDLFTLGDDDVKGTETADLFGADEQTFDGIKERKTKFKSRLTNNKSNTHASPEVKDEGDDDFLKATRLAGVSGLEEYNDEQMREKSMFDDDDSRTQDSSASGGNEKNIMSEIFKKTGIHSAVEHDSILDKGNYNSGLASSMALIDNEATRIANDAVAALKESRSLTKKSNFAVPTWTGKFGAAGKFNSVNNSKRRKLPQSQTPFSERSSSPASSNSILANLRAKKEATNKRPASQSQTLITQLSSYMAGVDGNFSKSSQILEHLDVDLSDEKTVKVVRNMLKSICSWDKEKKGWVLNPEFR